MKREISPRVRLIAAAVRAALSLLFALFVLLSGASFVFGWFTPGADRSGIGKLESAMRETALAGEYTVFAFYESGNYATTREIDAEGVPGDAISLSSVDISAYDRTFVFRNPYTPVFVRIALPRAQISEEGVISCIIKRDPAMSDDASGQTALSSRTSSVIRFSLIVDPTLTDASAGAEDEVTALYHAVNQKYYAASQSGTIGECFVEKVTAAGVTTYQKDSALTLFAPYDGTMWNGNTLYAFLYMTYDPALVNDFLDQNMQVGEDDWETEDMVNDLSTLIVMQTEVRS